MPGLHSGQGFVGKATGGWGISGTSIYQSGYPFSVFTSAAYNGAAYVSGAGAAGAGSGDYNADGDNRDFPNVSSYSQASPRSAFLTGVFSGSQFTVPDAGINGNEKSNGFRNSGFIETDATLYKNTHITERVNFQFRFEFFNVFNHPNFQNVQGDLSQANFGQVTSQLLPRFWQIGGKITF